MTHSQNSDSTEVVHPTTQYALDVVAGRIVAGPIVRGACRRHLLDLENGHERGLRFDTGKADRVFRYFQNVLRLNGGQFENIPFELHVSQKFILGNLFGWVKEDGTRRFRVAYIEEGKGNGKSPLVAGIGLYGMTSDEEPRAEVYAGATKKDQAMILFRDAVAMVDLSKPLSNAIKKSGRDDKVWNLFHQKSNSFFRPISSDDGQSGPRPHIALIDELHEHKTANIITMLSAGRKWRRQPLIIAITNSGVDKNTVCWEYHEMARLVNDEKSDVKDDTFFGYVCSMDDGDDPFKSEDCWIKANPLLDVVITRDYLRGEVNQARGMPSKESSVRRLNFCQWTSATNPFIPANLWEMSERTFHLNFFRGRPVYIGLDLSSTQDLTAAVFVCDMDGVFHWWPEFWIPEELLMEKVHNDRVPYDIWKRKGWIRTTPGKAIDKDYVITDIMKIQQAYEFVIKTVAYDRWRIEEAKSACKRLGISLPFSDFGQGFQSMGPAVDAFETSLIQGKIAHNGNPCLRWNAANVIAIEDPAGNKKFDKSKVSGRIDGIVAGVMAHCRATMATSSLEQPRIRWLA